MKLKRSKILLPPARYINLKLHVRYHSTIYINERAARGTA